MSRIPTNFVLRTLATLSLVPLAAALTGCGAGTAAPTGTNLTAMAGVVHGGQSAIQGSTVKLWVTNSAATDYKQAATLIGYATTDVNGNFQIADSTGGGSTKNAVNCPAGSMAFISAAGGYPSGNSALLNNTTLMIDAIGDCSTLTSSSSVIVNELTTVAAAYSLSSFMTTVADGPIYDPQISAPPANSAATGTAGTAAGLAHAFHNAAMLVNPAIGQVNATTTSSALGATFNGTIPVIELNTLGDIMQACIDSVGGDANCTNLFSYTPSISGTAPTNTLQAFINLARNPYPSAASVTSLFGLAKATAAFQPILAGAPADWALSVIYKGALVAPYNLALDANDTVYFGGSAAATMTAVSNYATTVAYTAGTGSATRQVAVDASGHIWAGNNGTSLFEWTGTAAPTAFTFTGAQIAGVAVDAAGNVWVGSGNTTTAISPNLWELNASSTPTAYAINYTSARAGSPVNIFVDGSQNIWLAEYYITGTNAVVLPNLNAATLSSTPTYTTSGTSITGTSVAFASSATKPLGVVVDSLGNAWYGITGSNTVTTTGLEEAIPSFTSSVITNLAPQTLIANATLGAKASQSVAIDGSGSVYLPDNQGAGGLGVHVYSTTTSAVLSPAAGYLGCNVNTTTLLCGTGSSVAIYNPRNVAIDSTGSIWTGITSGGITQTIGVAAPSWPLLSVGKPGVAPGLTTPMPLP